MGGALLADHLVATDHTTDEEQHRPADRILAQKEGMILQRGAIADSEAAETERGQGDDDELPHCLYLLLDRS
jgi:hypothetical protein